MMTSSKSVHAKISSIEIFPEKHKCAPICKLIIFMAIKTLAQDGSYSLNSVSNMKPI